MSLLDDQNRRTDELLANFRGNPHEFQMLKGILCMDHGLKLRADRELADSLFNDLRIASRMDEINAEAIAEFKTRHATAASR
jgi:hypothetical protein